MDDPDAPRPDTPSPGSVPLVRREVVLLLILSIVAIGLFTITRGMAEGERQRKAEEAAFWFFEGRALLEAGRSDDAVAALRRAVLASRGNVDYGVALAAALTEAGRDGEARTQLTRLRDLAPDNAEVHYRLARLFARTGESELASRHYYLALYSPDADAVAGERRRVGVELATYLLDQGDRERAADVLTAVARELVDEPADRLEVAALLERAGRLNAALAQFAAAADLDEASAPAASGAGRVAMRLGDYVQAEAFLRRAVARGSESDREQLDLVVSVRRLDPLAPGLSSRTRASRLADALAWADRALAGCAGGASDDVADQLADVRAFRRANSAADLRDADVLAAGVAVVVDAAAQLGLTCDEQTGAVRAWRLIGSRTGGNS